MSAPGITGDHAALGRELARDGYLRVRQRPRWTDGDYLCLTDLSRLIERESGEFSGDVFDYGCGGAPYADLFAKCRSYVKADVLPGPLVDRLLGADGLTTERDASYDWIFSTQVLEHVKDPQQYLRESLRLLRPGGRLLLTTHGFYREHGCPHDFHRWTLDGLVAEAEKAGFEVEEAGRLTVGVRAAVQWLHHCVWNLRVGPGRPVAELFLGILRKLHGLLLVPVLNAGADLFREQWHSGREVGTPIYVGVYLRARRPEELRHG